MNKYGVFILGVLMVFFITASAQQQLDHQKRTYHDADGNLYWNKELPVYIYLSTSESSEKIKLNSKISKNYTNPFYFDTEGMNTVRTPHAVDPKTKKMVSPLQDIIFEVYADGIAPATNSTFSPAPKYVKSGTIYYGKGLTVSLKSTDAVSGVEKTYYSINGEGYQAYSSDIAMNQEGNYSFKYYAADNVGNAENPSTRTYIVDLTSPQSNHSTSEPKLEDIL